MHTCIRTYIHAYSHTHIDAGSMECRRHPQHPRHPSQHLPEKNASHGGQYAHQTALTCMLGLQEGLPCPTAAAKLMDSLTDAAEKEGNMRGEVDAVR